MSSLIYKNNLKKNAIQLLFGNFYPLIFLKFAISLHLFLMIIHKIIDLI